MLLAGALVRRLCRLIGQHQQLLFAALDHRQAAAAGVFDERLRVAQQKAVFELSEGAPLLSAVAGAHGGKMGANEARGVGIGEG